jgi:hypothetical protein
MEAFYRWAEASALGEWMRSYTYAFANVEVVHLLGLTLMLGTVFTVNFRLLGLALRSRPVSEIADGLKWWRFAGYVVTLGTGVMLFASEAIKMSDNPAWNYKLPALIFGLILQFTLWPYVTKPGKAEASPFLAKSVALVSTLVWLFTGLAARFIAFI